MNEVLKLFTDFTRLMREINQREFVIIARIVVNAFFIFWFVVLLPIMVATAILKTFFAPKAPKQIGQLLRLEYKQDKEDV